MSWKAHFTAGATIVLVVALLGCGLEGPVPNQGAGDKSGSATAGGPDASAKNLKQIGLGMQNYASTFSNAFPSAAQIKDGKPYCSWRVKLLPFLGESDLYKQYHINEPWDSPHNLEVAKTIPKVYHTPGLPADGSTCYMVFVGKGAPFDASKFSGSNVPLSSFMDGTTHTILVVEAGLDKAVPWTKPDDLPFDPASPRAALGQIPAEGFLSAMGDVAVYRFNVDDAMLKALITPAGNEEVDMHKGGITRLF